jgi:hypothetical protein
MRFSTGACGGAGANRVVEEEMAAPACLVVAQWCPLRANPGVDATIQATASAAAKKNFMIAGPRSAPPPVRHLDLIIERCT